MAEVSAIVPVMVVREIRPGSGSIQCAGARSVMVVEARQTCSNSPADTVPHVMGIHVLNVAPLIGANGAGRNDRTMTAMSGVVGSRSIGDAGQALLMTRSAGSNPARLASVASMVCSVLTQEIAAVLSLPAVVTRANPRRQIVPAGTHVSRRVTRRKTPL